MSNTQIFIPICTMHTVDHLTIFYHWYSRKVSRDVAQSPSPSESCESTSFTRTFTCLLGTWKRMFLISSSVTQHVYYIDGDEWWCTAVHWTLVFGLKKQTVKQLLACHRVYKYTTWSDKRNVSMQSIWMDSRHLTWWQARYPSSMAISLNCIQHLITPASRQEQLE